MSNSKKNYLTTNKLLSNFFKLFAGTTIAKLVSFLVVPALSRLLTPEEFGEYSVFMAVVTVVAPLLALRYVDAIPIPRSGSKAQSILILSLALIFLNGTVALAIAYFFIGKITEIYPFIDKSFLLWIYFTILALSCYEMLNLWAVRVRSFGVIAKTQISQSFTGAVSKLVLAYLSVPMALIVGQTIQNFTGLLALLKNKDAPFKKYKPKFSINILKSSAVEFAQYPKYRLASRALLVVTQAIPVMAISKLYGAEEAGQLGLAFTVVTASVMVIVDNVRKLYFGESSRIGPENLTELKSLTFRLMFKMLLISLLVSSSMYFIGGKVFVVIFGNEWQLAGEIVEIYSLYVFSLFFAGPFVDILNVMNKQKTFLLINFVRFLLVSCLFIILSTNISIHELLWSYSISMLIFYSAMAFYFITLVSPQKNST
ncbi:lipopolysaccharide biosynthesis protein [Pseudoalteromonas sp. P1-25]|uniref:lipopolysaccharide biosynthesis protein n=1 Tax=Pseudoalteromonas sp. P1-25 TaxID=1723758 RepID=UPI0006D677D8|nr:lipopolysaccharide biosynthesis protein [Pseudoalteromonas sp. P1-25]KPZ51752.1 colanic acid exporter [Pseudoalteromonas sp. P1-25]